MVNFIGFDIFVIFLIFGIIFYVSHQKLLSSKKYELTTLLILSAYRLSTFIYLRLGGSFTENAYINDRFDHKWIGATIILLVIFFWPRKKWADHRPVILGLGTGMVIDEISEILSLTGIHFPAAFRDSLPDLGLIIGTFVIFIFIRRALAKLKLRGKITI